MRKLIAALTAVGLGLTTFSAFAPTAGAAPPPGTTTTASPSGASVRRPTEPARGSAARSRDEAVTDVVTARRRPRSATAAPS